MLITSHLLVPFLQWKGQQEYINAERKVWRVNPSDVDVAGYVR